jgi:hypothetical protein
VATPFLHAVVFSIMYIRKSALFKICQCCWGTPRHHLLCGGGTGPRKFVDVCGPSNTRATKVHLHLHHSPGKATGVGEGL